jgi:hypothetical protein
MSLRTNYTGALDTALGTARLAGYTLIHTTVNGLVASTMAAQAAKGNKTFTFTTTVSFQPADLRLLGDLWEAYKSGVMEALHSDDIMDNEVDVALNTSDQTTTSIDLNFHF